MPSNTDIIVSMNIQFYSHACFSIENEDAILLNDPYLSGTAFNDGWDLIVDDVIFDRFTEKKLFIYYSHEHPDHFSIPFLKSIDKEIRKGITIIVQKTRDKRVKLFLESQDFSVLELDNRERIQFSTGFFITIGQVPFYDSWALIEVDGKKILNANDCILETPDRVQDIKTTTDSVDILFTQFSYANWVEGGVSDNTSRALLAKEKLQKLCPKFRLGDSPLHHGPFLQKCRPKCKRVNWQQAGKLEKWNCK